MANPPEEQPNLAEFTSTVVHDLQAPLRSLNMFTELLTQEYQNKLDERGQLYLHRISQTGSRMQTLIENLLTYSRTGTGAETWITVNLNQVVTQVELDLQSEITKTSATITVDNLPTLLINPQEIRQLFQNLLENALKFGGENPQITISTKAQGEKWLFAIKDNGIGISPEYQSQIFEIFQRLHPVDVYPGTGMGLAICQKIVKGYDGAIWVESTEQQGSTFYFTLPMNPLPQSHNAKIV